MAKERKIMADKTNSASGPKARGSVKEFLLAASFLTFLSFLAVALPPSLTQTVPTWGYVYYANALPDALTQSDTWTRSRLSGGRSIRNIENGRLHVDTA